MTGRNAMPGELPGPTLLAVIGGSGGLMYGVLLAFLGFLAARAGHGTLVPLGLASSPFGLTGMVILSPIVTPALWCGVGVLLAFTLQGWAFRASFLAVMLAHYAALPFILSDSESFGNWDHVHRVGRFFPFIMAVYVAGQVVVWALFILGFWWPASAPGETTSGPPPSLPDSP